MSIWLDQLKEPTRIKISSSPTSQKNKHDTTQNDSKWLKIIIIIINKNTAQNVAFTCEGEQNIPPQNMPI